MVAIAKRLVPTHKISLLQREHFRATHDTVTGLLNQIALDEYIEQQIMVSTRYDKSFALLMIELDPHQEIVAGNSKQITNTLLLDFAKRLKCSVRCTDIVARVENNVFSILLSDIQDFRNVVKVVENINHQLVDPFLVKDGQYVVNATIGIEVFPNTEKSHKSLSDNAFIAMCRARHVSGKNYVFFDNDLDQKINRQIYLEDTIREAIEQQQYDIHYLPVNTIHGNALSCMQADVVWYSELLRKTNAETIKEYIESQELSKLFGEVQLTLICQKLSRWVRDIELNNKPVFIALDKSQFDDRQLPDRYQKIMDASGVATEMIGLMVKEQYILENVNYAVHQIHALKEKGFNIVIDRFCCGLSYLGRFAHGMVDMIKLDAEVISRLDERMEWLAVVEGLIRIARQLDIQTLIDGINNDFQYQTLLNMNADYWQGDYAYILNQGFDLHVIETENVVSYGS
ncbi:EAL domain-containing protein [Kaarinaea lacus]